MGSMDLFRYLYISKLCISGIAKDWSSAGQFWKIQILNYKKEAGRGGHFTKLHLSVLIFPTSPSPACLGPSGRCFLEIILYLLQKVVVCCPCLWSLASISSGLLLLLPWVQVPSRFQALTVRCCCKCQNDFSCSSRGRFANERLLVVTLRAKWRFFPCRTGVCRVPQDFSLCVHSHTCRHTLAHRHVLSASHTHSCLYVVKLAEC